MKDFFISCNQADVRWAEWIAWKLEEEGYSTVLQAWDFRPGCNFVLEMDRATKEAERTMPVLSPDFLASNYTPPEWAAAFAQDPESKNRKLLPVKVRSCKPEGLLAAIVHIDIVGLDEDAAKKTIIEGVLAGRAKPESKPHFPAERSITTRPSFPKVDSTSELSEPGDLPSGSRLPFLRNAVFTGREKDLLELANVLLNSKTRGVGITQAAAVTTSPGGMGKSQLAIEFCYRYGRFFQGVHWIQANQDIPAEIAACGMTMELPYWPDKIPEQVDLTLKAWKDGDPRLIVLDNVEEPNIVEGLLLRLPKARLLLTSRRSEWPEDLGVVIWPLETLPRPQSRELLRKLAPRLRELPDEKLDDIAERLGDLPLALDLAGRYLKDRPDLSPDGYLIELDKAGSALEHTSLKDWVKHSPTKHATSLAATFALSWNRLNDEEIDVLAKQIFKACGYCAPNVPIPRQLLAKALKSEDAGPKLDLAMRRLSELGLITPTDKGPTLHLLLAEFARIQDRDAEESILPILAETIAVLANQANESGLPEQMKPLREHLRAVAQASEASGQKTAGELRNELGIHLCSLAEYKEGIDNLKRALSLDENVYGFEHKDVATDIASLGVAFTELGDWQEAKNCCERALSIDEKVLGPNHPNVARDLDRLGIVLMEVGDLQRAKKCFKRALKIDEKVYGPDHPEVAGHVSDLGAVLRRLGDPQGAKKCYKRALKIDEKAYGPDHPNVAVRVNNLGMVLKYMGELAEAKENYERALTINEDVYGPDHLNVAVVANNLGSVLKDLGDLKGAKKFIERAIKIDEKVYGPDHPDVARDVGNLGLILKDQGELQEAKKLCETALKIAEKFYGEYHRNTATRVSNLGLVLKDQGDLEGAKKLYERALKIEEGINDHDHSNVAVRARAYGLLLKDMGDHEGAKKNLRRALRIAMERLGKDHPYTIEVRRDLNRIEP